MIRAIVVDDEKLVRKGFVQLVDWPRYGIQVVGEAADSQRALQLLDQQPVDLMFVDITMPGMSGFELISQVLEQNRPVQSVILTCHHEFDYVQEALRLGAVDYIVKTLLNKDNVDQTMQRIAGRLHREAERQNDSRRMFAGAMALRRRCGLIEEGDGGDGLPDDPAIERLSPELAIWHPAGDGQVGGTEEQRRRVDPAWETIAIAPSDRYTAPEAESLIREQLGRWLFYAAQQTAAVSLRELAELREASEELDEEERQAQLQSRWRQYNWLLYGKSWQEWSDLVAELRPKPSFLLGLAQEMQQDCMGVMAWDKGAAADQSPSDLIATWGGLSRSLSDMALSVQRRMADQALSREVVLALIRALATMRRHACDDVTQSDVAKAVGMSRSYFSQCFKLFIGRSFGEVLRKMRIEQAQRLLLESGMSVQEISAAVGFDDHKHFSRTFRERVGMYPTEYRTLYHNVGGGAR